MRICILLILLCLLEACSKPQVEVVSIPEEICTLTLDSVYNEEVLLNATGIVATSDYLVVSNLSKDTIFDVFDRGSLRYLYSDLINGQGPNDMLPFRWVRYVEKNDFYVVGLGVPVLTEINIDTCLSVKHRKKVAWENDICQNIFPLSDSKVLIQPGKKNGEWVVYDETTDKYLDMPEFPFKNDVDETNMFKIFQNRAVNVAIENGGERIAFFYVMFPFVRFLNDKGDVLCEANVGEEISNASRFLNDRHMYYTRCIVAGDYIYVKYIPKKEEGNFTYFQIWDWNGSLLAVFRIEDRLNLFTISPDGNTLYAVKRDNDHVFRCSLAPVLEKISNVTPDYTKNSSLGLNYHDSGK